MSRRLMLRNAVGSLEPILPDEYQRVEYIKKTSVSSLAFILLSVPSAFDNAEFKIVFNQPVINKNNAMCMFGASVGGKRPGNYYISRGSGVSGIGIGNTYDFTVKHFPQIVGEQTFELIVDNANKTFQAKRDGAILQSGSFTGDASGVDYLGLFGCYTGSTLPVDGCGEEHLIYFSAKIDNIARFELYPCYRKNDNVVGLFNIVNSTFVTSPNGGAFVKGADVT